MRGIKWGYGQPATASVELFIFAVAQLEGSTYEIDLGFLPISTRLKNLAEDTQCGVNRAFNPTN